MSTNRVEVAVSVNDSRYDEGIAFQSPDIGTRAILIYFRSKREPRHDMVLYIIPETGEVGINANSRVNGSILVADRLLIQSAANAQILPLDLSIKSGMAEPNFRILKDGTFTFSAIPDHCAERREPSCFELAKKKNLTRWRHLPFGEWRVRLISG